MSRAAEHPDIGPGAEHLVLPRTQHHRADLGMLEAHPLHDVGEFDVDPEVIGIELELVALEQPAVLIDIHVKGRDRAVVGDAPVPIFRGVGLEIDALAHRLSPECIICHLMYYTAYLGLARAKAGDRSFLGAASQAAPRRARDHKTPA